MADKNFEYKIGELDNNKRIDAFVLEKLNVDRKFDVDAKTVKKLFEGGKIYLNRARTKLPVIKLKLNDQIELRVRPKDLQQKPIDVSFELLNDQHVLYGDPSIIILNKPAGLPTQGTLDPTRDHLFAAVQRFLRARNPSREHYVGLHHRLDRDTSGVVLMSKKKTVNKACGELFSERKAVKEYLAICHKPQNGEPLKDRWFIRNYLDRSQKHKMRMEVVNSGGDLALTHFKLIKDFGNYVLVSASPKTGRMHQIRVHLASIGMNNVGDGLYTPWEMDKKLGFKTPRCLLHARSLTFPHPVGERLMVVEARPPADFLELIGNVDVTSDTAE